ncbi:MAG TPA: hypothetical protein P5040_09425 [Smithella sp.]|nr:hypothetical protein [Smithella sp.]HRS98396.1 hypothetical protein [Smithella sp.]
MEGTPAKITADATLLDVVSRWPAMETVFRRYDEKAGVCLCCTCLFDTLGEIASRFDFDLKQLLSEILETAAKE